jgi:hypothetical protein
MGVCVYAVHSLEHREGLGMWPLRGVAGHRKGGRAWNTVINLA